MKLFLYNLLLASLITYNLHAAARQNDQPIIVHPTIQALINAAVQRALQQKNAEHARCLAEEQNRLRGETLSLLEEAEEIHVKKEHAYLISLNLLLAHVAVELRSLIPEPQRPNNEFTMILIEQAFDNTKLTFAELAPSFDSEELQDSTLHLEALAKMENLQSACGLSLLESFQDATNEETDSAVVSLLGEQ